MKVSVYFCKEHDVLYDILRKSKLSRQALDTIYDLVWECEFKNIINVGKIWLRFIEHEKKPFGVSLRKKRSHNKIAPGDIIQVANDFYVVDRIGIRKIQVND